MSDLPPGMRRIDPDAEAARLAGQRKRIAERAGAEAGFLAASIAVWREIDRLDGRPEGYHPTDMDVELRRRERAAWERYRDLLDGTDD